MKCKMHDNLFGDFCTCEPEPTKREIWAAAFQRENTLRRRLATVAPGQKADLEAQIAEAAEETRRALLSIRPAAEEGRGMRTIKAKAL